MSRFNTDLTIRKVKAYGSLGLYTGSQSGHEVACEATAAIIALDNKNLDLATLMISSVVNDSSYESIVYSVDTTSGMSSVPLVRTIIYKQVEGMAPRENVVTYGPLIPLDKAEALLAILNS